MPKSLYDNSDITQNSKQLDVLKKNFPNCFDKNGNFIAHKMEEIVGNAGLELSKESYALNWLGKSYARLLANENPRTLLKEDKVHNAKEAHKNSENLLIKGDNLEVLKHLSNAYSESIKMIYIDPPYNTGGDGFVYNDDRKFSKEELSKLAGIDLDEAKRILEFTSSKSNSHSAWLTFMYPRLYMARELLREDGVIFISIDDNEVSQLKLLCDEVFGEENFLSNIIWEKRFTRSNNSKTFATLTEHILCYRKSDTLDEIKEPRNEKSDSTYTNPDNDYRGIWTSVSYVNPATKEKRPNLSYELTNPITKELVIHPTNAWKYSKETYSKHIKEDRLYWGKDGNNTYPRLKRFLSEMNDGMVPVNFWNRSDAGTTDEASKTLEELMGSKVFDFPKPYTLITKAMNIGMKSNDLILDFFAGSGTTAHAVMALNAEDGGNRKFITVQIPEKTDEKSEAYKAGYNTIFDITKARIEKASEQLGDKSGFKIYETSPMFEGYLDDMEELNAETTLFNGKALNAEEIEVLLTTWKAYDGMLLTDDLDEVLFGTYRGYYGKNTLYFMHDGFSMEALQAFIEKLDDDQGFEPSKLIVFGYNFESKHQRELKEALTNYKNKKSIELEMVARY